MPALAALRAARPPETSTARVHRHPRMMTGASLHLHSTGRSVRVGEVPETVVGQLGGRAATLPSTRSKARQPTSPTEW